MVESGFGVLHRKDGDMANKSKYSREGVNRLFDHLLRTYRVKNDRALANLLGVLPPVVSKIRSGHAGMGDTILLAVHEVFEMPIKDIKGMLSDS